MKLGKRTQKLFREAAVMGFVQGALHASNRSWDEWREDIPNDDQIVTRVLRDAQKNDDLYPTLSKVEVDEERTD